MNREVTWGNKISQGKKLSIKSQLASKVAGKKMGSLNKGKPSSRKGTRLSEKIKNKIKETCIRKGLRPPLEIRATGEKNYCWKGGISFLPYTLDWTETLKKSIRERDRYICRLCLEPQGERVLAVHHIDYNKKNCDPNNLISLCQKCHSKTNHNRNYWTNYFKTHAK
jgi:5-methylcytosine-specific restriction endonuclease McrA